MCSCGEHEEHHILTSRSTCTLAALDTEAAIISEIFSNSVLGVNLLIII